MNEQASMMNQPPMMNPPPLQSLMSGMSQQPPPPPPPQMLLNPAQPQQQQQQMMNRGYGMWGPPLPPQPMDLQLKFQNSNPMKAQGGGFGKVPSKHQLGPRNNWKGKKVNKPDKRKDLGRRMDNTMSMGGGSSSSGGMGIAGNSLGIVSGGGFHLPSLKELQYQNRVKTRRYFQKNHYNNNNNKNNNNMGKFAPRNTTSYIIRSKKSGGIAELVSPCPVTPAVLPTPVFSPSREVLVDMAKEEWGVDGYGSMKGLIRLRSPGNEGIEGHEEEDEEEGGSSESDVEEHVEVERRLDHDLSRFEMIYPNYGTVGGTEYNNVLENRVDDQDSHIAQLEEENLILKERLFLMERELGDLRRRLQSLERHSHGGDDINEEVVENSSENESDSRGGAHSMEDNNEEMGEENVEAVLDAKSKEENAVDGNQCAIKTEENIAEIRGQEDNKDKIQVNDVEIADIRGQEDNKDETKISGVEIADIRGQEDNKDETKVRDVENEKDLNDSVEAPEKTSAGGDVCMGEVAHSGKGFIEDN